jgi:hypothetical protein
MNTNLRHTLEVVVLVTVFALYIGTLHYIDGLTP